MMDGSTGAVAEVDMALLEKADLKFKKREYMRNMMAFYRQERREETETLKTEVAALQKQLARHSKRSLLLPWKEVAVALKEERDDAEATNETLRRNARELKSLVSTMKQWVNVNVTRSCLQSGMTTTWRHVSLCAEPQARSLGKEWITQQMFHNPSRMFGQFAYPDIQSNDEFYDVAYEWTDARLQYYHRRQYVLDVPMEFMLSAYKEHLCSILMMDWFGYKQNTTLQESSGNTTLHQLVAEDDEWMNLITGEFHQADGSCIFVIQQIEDDEARPMPKRQRNRMVWLDVRPMPDGRTKVRVLYRFAQYFTKDGYVSLDEEAETWGCDLSGVPEEKKEDTFRQYATNMLVQINSNHQRRINSHLTLMMLKERHAHAEKIEKS
ncbi:unnamed protein product [Aphanomyces euteiches]